MQGNSQNIQANPNRTTIELVRNLERAIGLRKQNAISADDSIRASCLGSITTTPNAYLIGVWDLFGDGRSMLNENARLIFMMAILQDFKKELGESFSLRPTLGTANLLGKFVSRYSGIVEFDRAVTQAGEYAASPTAQRPDELNNYSDSQLQVLQVLNAYFQKINDAGLIEPGSAAAHLSNSENTPSIREIGALSSSEKLFTGLSLANLLETAGLKPAEQIQITAPDKNVETRFEFATGATSLTQVTLSEIKSACESAIQHVAKSSQGRPIADTCRPHVVVFAADPLAMYNVLAPYICENDWQAACKADFPISETRIGIAVHAMCGLKGLLKEGPNWRTYATDFAYCCLSGVSPADAQSFNALIRNDSLMTCEQGLSLLKKLSPLTELFENFVQEPTTKSFDKLEMALKEPRKSAKGTTYTLIPFENRETEESALTELRVFIEICQFIYSDKTSSYSYTLFKTWYNCAIPVSLIASPKNADKNHAAEEALIEFRPTSAFDAFPPSSVDSIIFADLTKEVISIPAAHPATDSLLANMKITDARDFYQEKREAFASAISAARSSISCIMPMRNSAGAQLYPSFLYDELVQAISPGDTKTIDDEKVFAVPSDYDTTRCITDESDLEKGFGNIFASRQQEIELNYPARGILTKLNMNEFMSHYKGLPILSPSQIETYTKCPYNWFVSRKLRLENLDEELNNMVLGSLAHEVFERTFNTLATNNIFQITEDTVEEAKSLASKLFDDVLKEQLLLDPQANTRCVRADEHDEASLRMLKRQILSAIETMQNLPQDFSVWNHEIKIGPEHGRIVSYANDKTYLNGSIDRIDIDRKNSRYIIYDYKGSVTGHEAGLLEDSPLQDLPEKIQALIYAQALKRPSGDFGFDDFACIGAVYLGYKKAFEGLQLKGSVSDKSEDLSKLVNKKSIVQANSEYAVDFHAFLDAIESLIEKEILKMQAGIISPYPKTPKACEFCDVVFCEMRKVAEENE